MDPLAGELTNICGTHCEWVELSYSQIRVDHGADQSDRQQIRAVNYFTGNFDQPIKLEILATGAAVDVNSLTVIGFIRRGG